VQEPGSHYWATNQDDRAAGSEPGIPKTSATGHSGPSPCSPSLYGRPDKVPKLDDWLGEILPAILPTNDVIDFLKVVVPVSPRMGVLDFDPDLFAGCMIEAGGVDALATVHFEDFPIQVSVGTEDAKQSDHAQLILGRIWKPVDADALPFSPLRLSRDWWRRPIVSRRVAHRLQRRA